jgi:hypothetical protein
VARAGAVSKRRRPSAGRRLAEQRFWGAAAPPPESPGPVRPTGDPAVVVRSLGPAPLAVDPAVVERHLTAVYEEAVRAATALAAANGLLATDDETEEAAR